MIEEIVNCFFVGSDNLVQPWSPSTGWKSSKHVCGGGDCI